jgi:uncharacterized protein YndB with AHSA1/START domain
MTWAFVASQPGDDPIVVECYFAATPAAVFRAWTDAEIVKQWFGRTPNSLHSATIDLKTGGAWQFLEICDATRSVGFEGAYLAIEPDKRLLFNLGKSNHASKRRTRRDARLAR